MIYIQLISQGWELAAHMYPYVLRGVLVGVSDCITFVGLEVALFKPCAS